MIKHPEKLLITLETLSQKHYNEHIKTVFERELRKGRFNNFTSDELELVRIENDYDTLLEDAGVENYDDVPSKYVYVEFLVANQKEDGGYEYHKELMPCNGFVMCYGNNTCIWAVNIHNIYTNKNSSSDLESISIDLEDQDDWIYDDFENNLVAVPILTLNENHEYIQFKNETGYLFSYIQTVKNNVKLAGEYNVKICVSNQKFIFKYNNVQEY